MGGRPLEAGAEVAVSGGGPAASAFAIGLLGGAQLRGLRPSVRLYDGPEQLSAQPPAVLGPLARHRLASLGVVIPPELAALELRGILIWSAGRSELLPIPPANALVIDGWPAQAAGSVLLDRLLQQAAALRGARLVGRPVDAVEVRGDHLALLAGGGPERAQLLCATRPLPGRDASARDAVRARLFASSRACVELGTFIRLFVRPCQGVDLLLAVPSTSSLHITAWGARPGASQLALAMAELRRQGALPAGLEIAELAAVRLGWGKTSWTAEPHVLHVADAYAASPLDPLGPALEQGQRAAHAVLESAAAMEDLPLRAASLLAGPRADAHDAVVAVRRLLRAGPGGPAALGRAGASGANGGFILGLGPPGHEARAHLWGPSLWGPFRRLWHEQGPGLPPKLPARRPVYVVDDDPAQRALLCEFLTARSLPVRALADELDLLAAAAEEPPRAVLLDVVLDWVDGLRLCRALRNHPTTRHTPIFVVSGLTRASDRRAALSAGADGFFAKPVDLEALARRLEGLRAL
ncbi:MAG: response regulator [Deltaproteobacteria bacterium]|nr:response regulator [Deltaproteobacteria bacterium]